ncbi:MAG TPA: glycerophosphodiester phosphodiesterase family protein [Bacteroidota bacterium]|nr:glycerophosphodiester phosphodiesterase family protein [Bacteroidota bacterium]
MFSWRTPRSGTLVVAHRGSSVSAPENTLAAFARAVADGADAFELDARLTADHKVVVIHDRTLARTAGGRGRVSDSTAASIRRLSAGAWFSEEFAGERVPFLEEALDLAAGKAGVNIELKFDSRRADPGPLVRRVRDIVRGFRHPGSILISSFHHGALALQRSVAPDIDTGVLVYPPGVPATSGVRPALRIGAGWLMYSGGNIRKSFVSRARGEGIRTMEYTVNGRTRLKRALRFGVDGVITDGPAAIRRLLERTAS